jgi:hypothetical protein
MQSQDRALYLLRMMPMKVFESDIQKKDVPGWSMFHSKVNEPRTYATKTILGTVL